MLYEACFLEGDEGSSFLHCLQTFCRHVDSDLLAKLWDEECLLLDVDVATSFASRVEFGSTNTVGVAASDL